VCNFEIETRIGEQQSGLLEELSHSRNASHSLLAAGNTQRRLAENLMLQIEEEGEEEEERRNKTHYSMSFMCDDDMKNKNE
jgi:hypothetical protein